MSSAQDVGRCLAMYLSDGVGLDGRRVISSEGLRTPMTPGRLDTALGAWGRRRTGTLRHELVRRGPLEGARRAASRRRRRLGSSMAPFPRRDMAVVTLVRTAA